MYTSRSTQTKGETDQNDVYRVREEGSRGKGQGERQQHALPGAIEFQNSRNISIQPRNRQPCHARILMPV